MQQHNKMQRVSQIFLALSLSLLAILALLGALGARAAASPAANLIVDTLIDENDGCSVGGCSLRDAIVDAAPGDTITFSVSGTIDISGNGQLSITKDLTIDGGSTITVSGGNITRVFNVITGHVVFDGLTIANGNVQTRDCARNIACGGGIALQNRDVMVTVFKSKLISNTVGPDGYGGGIYNHGGMTRIINSTFLSNSGWVGGGIFNDGGKITVTNSIFSNSLAGSAIFNGDGMATINDSTLSGNNGSNYGGGIANGGIAIINNTTISNNYGGGYGGGIHNFGNAIMTINNSTLSNNMAGAGGGICTSGILTITNSTLSGNLVTSGFSWDGGGAVCQFITLDPSSTVIINSTITGNTAPNLTGRDGIWLEQGTMIISNTIVAGNGTANCNIVGGTFNGNIANIADDDTCPGFIQVADPLLGPLQDNGGDTFTHALLDGSPAIDAGNSLSCPAADQRGVSRPLDGDGNGVADCDVGAFEFMPPPAPMSGAVITGPLAGGTHTDHTFTATVAPITATTPITYVWQAVGQSPITHTGGLTDRVEYRWTNLGVYTVTVQARNISSTVTATHQLAITFVPTYVLMIHTTGSGIVRIIPNQPYYYPNQVVELIAVPGAGHLFTGWSGAFSGTLNPAYLTMDHSNVVTAHFNVDPTAILTNVTVTGPAQGIAGNPVTFTAQVLPDTAVQPITYIWQALGQSPVTHTGSLTDSVTWSWPNTGTYTVTAVAANAVSRVTGTHAIELMPAEVEITAVALTGPATGMVGQSYAFTVTVSPVTATLPVTYVWQAAGTAVTRTGSLQDVMTFSWDTWGRQGVTVTADNGMGTPETAVASILIEPLRFYVPIALKPN